MDLNHLKILGFKIQYKNFIGLKNQSNRVLPRFPRSHWWNTPLVQLINTFGFEFCLFKSNLWLLIAMKRSPFVTIGNDISGWELELPLGFAYNISSNFFFILHVNMVEVIKWFLEILKTIKTHKFSLEQIILLKTQNWTPN
jgi:hypothetical protein